MNANTRVKRFVEDHGYTQSAIAKKMGIPRWKFNNIMTGRKVLSADELVAFCDAVDKSTDYILSYGD